MTLTIFGQINSLISKTKSFKENFPNCKIQMCNFLEPWDFQNYSQKFKNIVV